MVSQVETLMQDALAEFAQKMYQYMGDEVAKLADELAALRYKPRGHSEKSGVRGVAGTRSHY